MAGHSQFNNIMYRKGAQDKKRAKLFAKLGRELTVASKEGGDDPQANPRLRAAIAAARGANMPKDNIERSEEHTSELQSLMRISYAVFCLKTKKTQTTVTNTTHKDYMNHRT